MQVYRCSQSSLSVGCKSRNHWDIDSHLDSCQQKILWSFREGKSIAILGGAGAGKTRVLQEIVKLAPTIVKKSGCFAACALSNSAASRIHGCTLHSLFGAPPSWEWSNIHLMDLVMQNKRVQTILRGLKLLVIDEISLVKRNEIEAMDYVLRRLTEDENDAALPLGGRQLVVAGDAFQLEPCGIDDRNKSHQTFFESRVWSLCFGEYGDESVLALLDHNHRQSNDKPFHDLLQRVRYGNVTESDIKRLNSTGSTKMKSAGSLDEYTRLCLYRHEAAYYNRVKLNELNTVEVTVLSQDKFYDCEVESALLRLDQVAEGELVLKEGCHVVLTRNIEDVTAGTCCFIERIIENEAAAFPQLVVRRICTAQPSKPILVSSVDFHIFSFDCTVIAKRVQLPVLPAYAITIHRSMGMTLNTVAVDFTNIARWKPCGMVYVALSRARSLQGLHVTGLSRGHIFISVRAKKLMSEIAEIRKCLSGRIVGIAALDRYLECSSHWIEKFHRSPMFSDETAEIKILSPTTYTEVEVRPVKKPKRIHGPRPL